MTNEELRKELLEARENFTGRYDEDVNDIIYVLHKHGFGWWDTSGDSQGSVFKRVEWADIKKREPNPGNMHIDSSMPD